MGDIQWGLLDQNAFQTGYKQGKAPFDEMEERRKQAMKEAALRQYALHPDDPKSLNALAIADPTLAITARQTQETARLKGLDAHRDSIKVGAQIIRQINPKDEAGWQQALRIAKDAGVDLTGVPQNYDPNYVQGLIAAADALSPEKTPNSRIITPQPGGGAWELGPDGTLKPLIQPNDGSQAVGSPTIASSAPLVTDQASYDAIPPGGQFKTPDGHIRVKQGGQPVAPAGGFP